MSLPSTKSEHGDQPLLLASADLKAPDDSNREEQNDHILADVQTRCSEPDNVVVHTASVPHGLVPEKIDRVA